MGYKVESTRGVAESTNPLGRHPSQFMVMQKPWAVVVMALFRVGPHVIGHTESSLPLFVALGACCSRVAPPRASCSPGTRRPCHICRGRVVT